MKAVLFYGPKDIRYEELAEFELEPGEILLKIEAAFTGGTDVKTYLRGHPRIIKEIPSTFGYEFSGYVEKLGDSVTGVQLGDRVIASNTVPCYECFFCKKEEYSLCENLDFLNGSFAEYIKVPAKIVKHNFYKIPDDLDFESAAMTQTLAVALHGFRRSNIKAGDNLLIYGLGPIGQSFIKLSKVLVPDLTVIAVGRSQFKRDLARENGADYVYHLDDDIRKDFPYGADVVIEAVGKPDAWQHVMQLVRPGGLVNFFGGCPKGSKVEMDTFQLHYEEVRTIGVFHHTPKYMKEALELLASKKIQMKNLITDEMPLKDLEKALEKHINGEAMKILIRP